MPATSHHLAVDLGASSGRVALVRCTAETVAVLGQHRFDNAPVPCPDETLRWDLGSIIDEIVAGSASLVERFASRADSIAIDSWGVDYGLLDDHGQLLEAPFCYRDARTEGLAARIDDTRAYALTGVPSQAINTATQLLAEDPARLARAARLLFVPDLVAHALAGATSTEPAIASTSQLLSLGEPTWSTELAAAVGVPVELLPTVRTGDEPFTTVRGVPALAGTAVASIASHDTASAIAATPITSDGDAYLSLGTWALLGVELTEPVTTAEARAAEFANERGAGGRIDFHRSAMGLWLLQECLRAWPGTELSTLLAEAADLPRRAVIDPDHPSLFSPGDMPARIVALCRDADQPVPSSPPEIARVIIDSLADYFAGLVATASRLTGRQLARLHVVGGGVRNELLLRRIAECAGIEVVPGPAEATLLGNALQQARHFAGPTTLTSLRELAAGAGDGS